MENQLKYAIWSGACSSGGNKNENVRVYADCECVGDSKRAGIGGLRNDASGYARV